MSQSLIVVIAMLGPELDTRLIMSDSSWLLITDEMMIQYLAASSTATQMFNCTYVRTQVGTEPTYRIFYLLLRWPNCYEIQENG